MPWPPFHALFFFPALSCWLKCVIIKSYILFIPFPSTVVSTVGSFFSLGFGEGVRYVHFFSIFSWWSRFEILWHASHIKGWERRNPTQWQWTAQPCKEGAVISLAKEEKAFKVLSSGLWRSELHVHPGERHGSKCWTLGLGVIFLCIQPSIYYEA